MKIIKVLGFAITVVLIMFCISGLDYVLSDDTNSYFRIGLHELYEQEHIESIFLGASHVYSGIDPAITDEAWGENTFNCSTASQRINTSYTLLKEADKIGGISTCYLELTLKGISKEIGSGQTPEVYNVSDYMKLSWNKISYLLRAVQPQDYVHAFCRARRNWKSIYSIDTMKETISKKAQDSYKNYAPLTKSTSRYGGKGFIYSTGEFRNVASSARKSFDGSVPEDFKYYFKKIVQYCQKHDITLICFSLPVTEFTMEAVGNYDAYYQKVQELCEEFGISYYDFNLANPSILKMEDNDFRDANHLNGTGAEKVTRVFADFFAGKIEKEELFYDSYAEKKEHLPKRFIGVILKRSKDKKICSITPLATKQDDYEYEVYVQADNGDFTLLQEKSPNCKIVMPSASKVKLKIRVYDSKGKKAAGFNKSV